jgi:hypothetical protein
MNEWEWHLLEDRPTLDRCIAAGVELKTGARVLLRPNQGGDIMDAALAGKAAVIEGIEQDYEGTIQVAVIVDDDPGRDLGILRQPGHRFFFKLDEIEPIAYEGAAE